LDCPSRELETANSGAAARPAAGHSTRAGHIADATAAVVNGGRSPWARYRGEARGAVLGHCPNSRPGTVRFYAWVGRDGCALLSSSEKPIIKKGEL